ncbi:MAG: KTSC domain-containing protein [Methanoregula sp.]|uniref:KTSC domain-containing protein n=1 Tax=Methanoregula sp. TaxID=2052170 RepID=UPI003C1E26C6
MVIHVERLSVKSRILRSVGYDDSTKILEIEFHTGLVYQYSGVPPKVYADLMHSNEVGKYFSEKVRTRFRTKQVVA